MSIESNSSPTFHRRCHKWAWAILAVGTVLRLIAAAVLPLDPDETYDWEWSRRLAPGYYDHPPGVAVLIRGGTALFGTSPLGVRVCAILMGTLGLAALVGMARRLGGGAAAFRAAVLLTLLPIIGLLTGVATPDAPLLAAWALALATLERALAAQPRSGRSTGWWMLTGLALGLGLCSKYTAVLLPIGTLIAFLVHPDLRRRLAEPGPYLACLLALAVFAPVLIWNAEHDWVSFYHQAHNGLAASPGWPWERELNLLAGQLAVASPILFILLVGSAGRTVFRKSPIGLVLALTTLTPLAFFTFTALVRSVHANWPAPAYLGGAVLLSLTVGGGRFARWFWPGCVVAGCCLLLVLANAAMPFVPPRLVKVPPIESLGATSIAERVALVRTSLGRSGTKVWVAANSYQEASQLAFYLPDHPIVFALNLGSRGNQYDFWPQFHQVARKGDDLLLVLPEDDSGKAGVESRLRPFFESCESGEIVPRKGGTIELDRQRIWIFKGWRGTWQGAGLPLSPCESQENRNKGKEDRENGLEFPFFRAGEALSCDPGQAWDSPPGPKGGVFASVPTVFARFLRPFATGENAMIGWNQRKPLTAPVNLSQAPRAGQPGKFRPRVEELENRLLLTVGTFTEDYTDNTNPGQHGFDNSGVFTHSLTGVNNSFATDPSAPSPPDAYTVMNSFPGDGIDDVFFHPGANEMVQSVQVSGDALSTGAKVVVVGTGDTKTMTLSSGSWHTLGPISATDLGDHGVAIGAISHVQLFSGDYATNYDDVKITIVAAQSTPSPSPPPSSGSTAPVHVRFRLDARSAVGRNAVIAYILDSTPTGQGVRPGQRNIQHWAKTSGHQVILFTKDDTAGATAEIDLAPGQKLLFGLRHQDPPGSPLQTFLSWHQSPVRFMKAVVKGGVQFRVEDDFSNPDYDYNDVVFTGTASSTRSLRGLIIVS